MAVVEFETENYNIILINDIGLDLESKFSFFESEVTFCNILCKNLQEYLPTMLRTSLAQHSHLNFFGSGITNECQSHAVFLFLLLLIIVTDQTRKSYQ